MLSLFPCNQERKNNMAEYYDPWAYTKTKHGLSADLVISALQK